MKRMTVKLLTLLLALSLLAAGFALAEDGMEIVGDDAVSEAASIDVELDALPELTAFADRLEKATLDTIDEGEITGDLALISSNPNIHKLNTLDFIKAVKKRVEA